MKGKGVLLIGGTSAIGRALARELAARGAALHLAARNGAELERVGADLKIRYQVPVSWSLFEATDAPSHAAFFADATHALRALDVVVIAVGDVGDQAMAERDADHARRVIESNYTGVISVLTPIANYLEAQGRGTIVVLSSVAGDRGRRANYVYGSAKGGLDRFLEGLRVRLSAANVRVLTVKPGLVDTRMTFGRPGLPLIASPALVARAILRGIEGKGNVMYVPWFWWWVMLGVRALPEPVFRRLKQ
jgi:decaprenylphospho-beta-D-erythro-pentofuranosid-2-ulose 2-reductase